MSERLCDECGGPILTRHPRARYCSLRCNDATERHSDRAKKLGVPSERVPRYMLFTRDSWMCWLCGLAILDRVGSNRASSPSIDHVIPLSLPGSPGHVWSNVKAAHKGCNSSKGTRVLEHGGPETARRLGVTRARVSQIVNGRKSK